MTEFIGRAHELRTCLELLHSPDLHGAVVDVVGVNGIGKSMFIDRLAELAKQDRRARVFRVDMREYGIGEGYSGEFGQNASTAMLRETLAKSKEMLGRLIELGSREFAEFRALSRLGGIEIDRQQGHNTIQLGSGAKIDNFTASVEFNSESNRDKLWERQQRIDDAFVSAWELYVRKRKQPVLVTIDAFELVADDQIGWWLVRDLARRLPRTLVVLARTPTMDTWLKDTEVDQFPLDHFTRDEVAEYLRQRCSGVPVSGDVTDIALRFTDGHPGGIGLVADLILEMGGPTVDALALRQTLDRLPAQPNHRWANLVDAILDAAKQPRLRIAVEAAAVADTFSDRLLKELIERSGQDEVRTVDVIPDLLCLRLLRQVVETSGRSRNQYRLHEFLRLAIEARMPAYDRSRWLELHRLAADHYFRSLAEIDGETRDAYSSWYRFEHPGWQDKKRRWLHHAGMLVDRRGVTRSRFLLVFLKAFWWWGWYVPFEFNRTLLEDWGRAAAIWANASDDDPTRIELERQRDRDFLDALTALLTLYPMGFPKPTDAPWRRIREQLLLVRSLSVADLGRNVGVTDEERHDITEADALLQVFLAHSVRFPDPADERAARYYLSARKAFEKLDDHWNVAWMLYERADMAFDAGDVPTAVALLAESADREHSRAVADDDWDPELQGNLHRLQGDIRWQRGEIGPAGVAYGRAVQQAYWCQGAWQGGPDEYTSQFYLEQVTRAARRVAELAEPGQVAEFVAGLREGGPVVCAEADPPAGLDERHVDDIPAVLFVAGPDPTELRTESSTYMANWRLRREDCVDLVDGLDDLRQPLDPA